MLMREQPYACSSLMIHTEYSFLNLDPTVNEICSVALAVAWTGDGQVQCHIC